MKTALRTCQINQTVAYQVWPGEYRTPRRTDPWGYSTAFKLCKEAGGLRGGTGWQVYFGQPARWLTGDDRFFTTLKAAVRYCDEQITRERSEMLNRSLRTAGARA